MTSPGYARLAQQMDGTVNEYMHLWFESRHILLAKSDYFERVDASLIAARARIASLLLENPALQLLSLEEPRKVSVLFAALRRWLCFAREVADENWTTWHHEVCDEAAPEANPMLRGEDCECRFWTDTGGDFRERPLWA